VAASPMTEIAGSLVLRGGSWDSYAALLCSASRNWDHAADHGFLIGFRVARTPVTP
jgi:formylglycine-generating enzyme required for sulfatase activity